MIKPEQIPDDVVRSARRAWLVADDGAVNDWRKAIAAAINAWPGAVLKIGLSWPENFIDLPIQKEKNDD